MSIAPLLLAFLSVAGCPVERFEFRSRPAQLPRRSGAALATRPARPSIS